MINRESASMMNIHSVDWIENLLDFNCEEWRLYTVLARKVKRQHVEFTKGDVEELFLDLENDFVMTIK